MSKTYTEHQWDAVTANLMRHICETRQANIRKNSQAGVSLYDIVNRYQNTLDPDIVREIIRNFAKQTGYFIIYSQTIFLREEGLNECKRQNISPE